MRAQPASLTKAPAKQANPSSAVNSALTHQTPVRRATTLMHAVPFGPASLASLATIPTFADEERGTTRPTLRLPLQRKLSIGSANDPLEAEADAVAERILSGNPIQSHGTAQSPVLRRACSCAGGEKCEKCKEEEEGTLQRSPSAQVATMEAPAIVHDVLRSPGRPLDTETRAFFEPRIGRDLSGVRVHTDNQAAESAQAVNARAYTVGNNIVFGAGQYGPGTDTARRLIAHELVHSVQQSPPSSTEARVEDYPRVTNLGQSILARATPAPAAGVTPPSPPPPQAQPADKSTVEAALIAVSHALKIAADEAGPLRDIYNKGAGEIAAKIAEMTAKGATQGEIAPVVAGMRHALAEQVREAGSSLMKAGAEAFDAIRGNTARPTYETLRAAGKTDAQIIESAARTNEFINRLPKGLRWTGRGLVLVSAGISIYVVVTAPPDQQGKVAAQELGGFAGGLAGGAIGEGICIAVGIATEGLGLILCGVLGGVAGFEAGRHSDGLFEEAVRRQLECAKTCESLPWYSKGFCLMGCNGPIGP